MFGYVSKNSHRLLTRWHRRKAEATKEVNGIIAVHIKVDLHTPDGKGWVNVWRQEDTAPIQIWGDHTEI